MNLFITEKNFKMFNTLCIQWNLEYYMLFTQRKLNLLPEIALIDFLV